MKGKGLKRKFCDRNFKPQHADVTFSIIRKTIDCSIVLFLPDYMPHGYFFQDVLAKLRFG